ncbi:hypothetical protein MN608_06824 [Microdochium nivale]|nr:hypothetical protein MN608_06824 [Microdochium nivale]
MEAKNHSPMMAIHRVRTNTSTTTYNPCEYFLTTGMLRPRILRYELDHDSTRQPQLEITTKPLHHFLIVTTQGYFFAVCPRYHPFASHDTSTREDKCTSLHSQMSPYRLSAGKLEEELLSGICFPTSRAAKYFPFLLGNI